MNIVPSSPQLSLHHRAPRRTRAIIFALLFLLSLGPVFSAASIIIPWPDPVNEVEVWPLNQETVLVIVPCSGFAEMVSRKGTTNIFRGHGGKWNWNETNRIAFVPPMTLCTITTNTVRALNFSNWVERVLFSNPAGVRYVAQLTNFVVVQIPSAYQLISTTTGEVKWTIQNPDGNVLGINATHLYLNRTNEPSLYGMGVTPHELRSFSTETGKRVWNRQINCFDRLQAADIFEDHENVWLESHGLHWLNANNGKIIREGAVSALGFVKLNGTLFIATREGTGRTPPDYGEVQTAVVYKVNGRKGTQLPYKILDPFHDGRTAYARKETSFRNSVCPFVENQLIFSGMNTRCYQLDDGEPQWEKPGQYKAQIGNSIFTLTGGENYILRRFDIPNGTEGTLATYLEQDLFGQR